MSEWGKVRLGDITTKIGSGSTPRGGGSCYKTVGISLIRSQNVLNLSFSANGLVFIDDEQARKLNNVIVNSGDVLLNITGDSVARSCMVPENHLPARVNQHVAIIRANSDCLSNVFLLYYLQYIKPYLLSISGIGGTRNALTKKMIEDLEINCPSLSVQQNIADILGSLDDKIELNSRINSNLESQAQALFKRWFVDFEFPDANGNPYKSSGGEFIDSELGGIPKGWRVGKFTSIIDILGGGTPKTTEPTYWNGKIPFFTPKDVANSCITLYTEKTITDLGLDQSSSKLYPKGTVFITARGTVGKVAIAGCDMAMNQSCYALIGKENHTQSFVYNITMNTVNVLKKKASGAVFDAITTRDFESENIIIPLQRIICNFEKIAILMYDSILCNNLQNQELINLRNTLLPKLMNNQMIK